MFEIHYKYTDYQTFKQTFRELFFPFLIIFQPLIRITNKLIDYYQAPVAPCLASASIIWLT